MSRIQPVTPRPVRPAAGKIPETYLAGKAVSLSRIVALAKKYSLPTRPYPPLSLKAGTSFRIVMPRGVDLARFSDVNRNSPIAVKVAEKAGRFELTVSAKAPARTGRQLDVVTLEWRAAGKMNAVSLGVAALPAPPRG